MLFPFHNPVVTYRLLSISICLWMFGIHNGYAQKGKKKIEIVHANSLEYDESTGVKAEKLIGDVVFKQDDVFMYCDSAYFYSKTNSLDAYDNVRIRQGDSLNLYGDSLHYDGNTKFAKLRGNIRLINNKIELTTSSLDYDIKNELGYYIGGGKIINKSDESVLTSKSGYYYPKTKFFFFKDSVKMVHPDYIITADTLKFHSETEVTYFLGPTYIEKDSSVIYCERGKFDPVRKVSHFVKNASIQSESQTIKGDSIFYNQDKGIGELFDNVAIIDTSENLMIYGDYSLFNEKDSSSLVTGNVLLNQVYDDDTFHLHADTLRSYYDSTKTNREISAYYHVKFYKNDMQGKCDSLIFSDADSTVKMFHNPVMWSEDNQMTGDFIEIKQYDGEIKFFTLTNNAFIVSEEDSTKYNQIKGKNMIGTFTKNELKKINVNGNGQTIYYAKEDNDSTYLGVNKVVCTNMVIYMDSSSVRKITFITQPTATLYPLDQVAKEELLLPGLDWKDHLRPKRKEDVFVWE